MPVDAATVRRARVGDWSVILTPRLPVSRDWFGELRGKRVLCLASGGGQQVPIFAAAGAEVVGPVHAKAGSAKANGGMQCEAPQAPLADANQRSGNDAMRPPFVFPAGWAAMRRLLCQAACEWKPPFAAPPFAHPSALRPNASPAFSVNRP